MRKETMLKLLACLIALSAPVTLAQFTVPAGPGAGMPFQIRLERFKVINADEDALYSDGDEPYLWVLYFTVDGTTVDLGKPGSASASFFSPHRRVRDHRGGQTQYTQIGSHDNLGRSGVDKGADFPIPPLLGTYADRLTPIRGLPQDQDLAKRATLAGVIVVAMDEDGSSEAAAEAGRREFERAMKEEINAAVRRLNPNVDANEIARRVADRVVDKMKAETLRGWTNVLRFLAGVADPDDFIGADFQYTTYEQIERSGTVSFTMDFRKSGAHYQVTGAFRRQ